MTEIERLEMRAELSDDVYELRRIFDRLNKIGKTDAGALIAASWVAQKIRRLEGMKQKAGQR